MKNVLMGHRKPGYPKSHRMSLRGRIGQAKSGA
jgi:hypothetical protein